MDFPLPYKIAKPAPIKLTKGYGTLEFDFGVAYTDHFPISPAWPLLYVNFLPHLERVRAKYCNLVNLHLSSFLSQDIG
jgi:hypothetical protein